MMNEGSNLCFYGAFYFRIEYIKSRSFIIPSEYMEKFEVCKRTFVRDIRFVREFLDYEIKYDRNRRIYLVREIKDI